MNARSLLAPIRLLPVVVIDDARTAAPLARVLLECGINAIEITLRTDAALSAIENIRRDVPDVLVGAGSITTPEHFQQILAAGASFAVSPGHTPALLDAASLPFIPGAATPSDCMTLMEAGYDLIKFFPAETNGGVAALRSWSGPLSAARFCPTGGINDDNVVDYLALDCVACIGGSWFVPPDRLAAGDLEPVRELTKHAVARVATK